MFKSAEQNDLRALYKIVNFKIAGKYAVGPDRCKTIPPDCVKSHPHHEKAKVGNQAERISTRIDLTRIFPQEASKEGFLI